MNKKQFGWIFFWVYLAIACAYLVLFKNDILITIPVMLIIILLLAILFSSLVIIIWSIYEHFGNDKTTKHIEVINCG